MNAFDQMISDLSEKERIRNLLGRVVSKEVADELLNSTLELGGEEKEVTILFSDIRRFTNVCEGESPKRILELLNVYLTEVATIIEHNHGVVDKFIGDAVMALFGAPIHSEHSPNHAVQAALAMTEMLKDLNHRFVEMNYEAIDIGIGINTGVVVAGNMGSKTRMNYTVIGDNVNLSSRLEGLTKYYGLQILVGEATKEKTTGIPYQYVDCVRVKGKQEAVTIYEPLLQPLDSKELQAYDNALQSYTKGAFAEARIAFEELYAQYSKPLYGIYTQRCQSFVSHPPENWSGIFSFSAK